MIRVLPDKKARRTADWLKVAGINTSQQMAEYIIANLRGYKSKSKHRAKDVERLADGIDAIKITHHAEAEMDAILERLDKDIPVALKQAEALMERLRNPPRTGSSTVKTGES